MKFPSLVAALAGLAAAAPSASIRDGGNVTVVHPGTVQDMLVTKDNTLNGTSHGDQTQVVPPDGISARSGGGASLAIELVNNFPGKAVTAYLVGLDLEDRVVFVRQDGTLVYPSSGGSDVPVPVAAPVDIPLPARGASLALTLPIPLASGRVYLSEGPLQFAMVRTATGGDGLVQPAVTNPRDPSAATDWGFVELTLNPDGSVFANISYVDFVGMILAMRLTAADAPAQLTKGLAAGSVPAICDGVRAQGARDGRPWGGLCVVDAAGAPVRVLSPNDYAVVDPHGFETYWDDYVDRVWARFADAPLVVDTQGAAGRVACRVGDDRRLACPGDDLGFDKPSARDVWGCDAGPFANRGNAVHLAAVARLCAAFVRSTLLLPAGDVQPGPPPAAYYAADPTDHYSRLVHERETDGRGYAFPYDDVNPGSENASGTVAAGRPDTLTVYVGGYSE